MCGIVGYIATKPEHADKAKAKFSKLLLASQDRGDDATGLAFVQLETIKGKQVSSLTYYKQPLPATEFVKDKKYLKIMKDNTPVILIGHTRAKTHGDQANNMNNHPIVTKNGLALVHNGIISNADEVFKDYKLERDAEVDSEAIVKLIEHNLLSKSNSTIQAIQESAKVLRGGMSCAMVSTHEPDSLYLWCSQYPLWLAYNKKNGVLFFGSTKEILADAIYDYDRHFIIFYQPKKSNYIFKEVTDNNGYKITCDKPDLFVIERPSYYSGYSWDKKDGDNNGIKVNIQKQLSFPKKNYMDVTDPTCPLKKPSKYFTTTLERRLDYLEEKIVKGTELTVDEERERGRINDCLAARYEKEDSYYTSN